MHPSSVNCSSLFGWASVQQTAGGFGDVMVYCKVTKTKLTTVDSTLLDDWRRLVRGDFQMIDRGPGALRAIRSVMDRNRVPRELRDDMDDL